MGNSISEMMKRDGIKGRMSIALRYNKGWRGGYFTSFGKNVELYSPDMYDEGHSHYVDYQDSFDRYSIFFTDESQSRLGDSDLNDCVYNALHEALYDNNPFKSPFELKKFLKLHRTEKVDIYEHIPLIEKKLKTVGINITGDYVYTSGITSNKRLMNIVY